MTKSYTITAAVGSKLLKNAAHFFDHALETIFVEMFQNARRAGATRISVDMEKGAIVVRDDGQGIDDPKTLLTLGDSDWDAATDMLEQAAGMGFWSLAGRGCTVRSRDYTMHISKDAFVGTEPAVVKPEADTIQGTIIQFPVRDDDKSLLSLGMPKDTVPKWQHAAQAAGRFFPIPIAVAGQEIERHEFFSKHTVIERGEGVCTSETFEVPGATVKIWRLTGHRAKVIFNLAGNVIRSENVGVITQALNETRTFAQERGFGKFCTGYSEQHLAPAVAIDIHDARILPLQLPDRKRFVETDALADILKEARRAYLAMAAADPEGHGYADHQVDAFRKEGIDMPRRHIRYPHLEFTFSKNEPEADLTERDYEPTPRMVAPDSILDAVSVDPAMVDGFIEDPIIGGRFTAALGLMLDSLDETVAVPLGQSFISMQNVKATRRLEALTISAIIDDEAFSWTATQRAYDVAEALEEAEVLAMPDDECLFDVALSRLQERVTDIRGEGAPPLVDALRLTLQIKTMETGEVETIEGAVPFLVTRVEDFLDECQAVIADPQKARARLDEVLENIYPWFTEDWEAGSFEDQRDYFRKEVSELISRLTRDATEAELHNIMRSVLQAIPFHKRKHLKSLNLSVIDDDNNIEISVTGTDDTVVSNA